MTSPLSSSLQVRRLVVTSPVSQALTLDFFPHRMTPQNGADLEDMILTILASLEGHVSEDSFSAHEVSQIYAQGLNHPYGHYGPGAVVVTPIEDVDGEAVRFENHQIILPDGRSFNRRDFAPPSYTPHVERQIKRSHAKMRDCLRGHPATGLALGVVRALLPITFRDALSQTPARFGVLLCARAARLVETGASASGKVAARTAAENASDLLRDFDWTWTVMPDRGWQPSKRVAGPGFDQLATVADPDLMALGEALAGQFDIEAVCAVMDDEAAISGDDPDLSNHARLALKGYLRDIDRAIEDGLPLDRLKPAARRRAARRRPTKE